MNIYLDSNATGLLDPRVSQALKEAIDTPLGNPSSPHSFGQAAKGRISEARRNIAAFLKVPQSQVIFTSGGSEGALSLLRGFLKKEQNPHIISSNIEHACVYETLEALKGEGASVTYLPAGLKGAIEPSDLEAAITPRTKLICLMSVNNETGVKADIEKISEIAGRNKIPLVVDGVAWLGKEVISLPRGISAIFFSGHKIHAPQGVGFIVLLSKTHLTPLILGGGQEFGLRGGTQNLLGIIGLGAAVSILQEEQEGFIPKIAAMRDFFENELLRLPGVSVNGLGPRVCNTTNLAFEGIDGETLLIALDQRGVLASLGSACSSGSIEPSRILLNMGVPMKKARSSLRFSFSRMNTMEEAQKAVKLIKERLKDKG
jgi:cysteine desulfurase